MQIVASRWRMKGDVIRTVFAALLLANILTAADIAERSVDRLIDVGGYRLHFHIIPGHGIPILFESGGGDDETVWKGIVKPVAALTGATLITYDRAGFGKSEMDPSQQGIVHGVKGLETGLRKLGYTGDIVLVAHSLGGFYATLYASRHPQHVKSAVLIDANLACFFTAEQLRKMQNPEDFADTVAVMQKTPFPAQIPVMDIVADRTLFDGTPDAERWKACHQQFVAISSKREAVIAYGSGHYIFLSSPELVAAAILKAYAGVLGNAGRLAALTRSVDGAVAALNDVKRKDTQYRHSESDLNEWGYALLQPAENENAMAVFQLNVRLYPRSGNVYDSLADCYEKMGNRELAIATYRRALEVDPKKKHSQDRLKALAPPGQN
jgi:pimeloyl-ACP methyl ester carboxylesterase